MKKLVLAVIALGFSVGVNAACTQKDLAGGWVSYAQWSNSKVVRCNLFVTAKNALLQNTSTCAFVYGEPPIEYITGSLAIDKYCQITGTIDDGSGAPMSIDAYLDKSKGVITGMEWITANPFAFIGIFNATKQK